MAISFGNVENTDFVAAVSAAAQTSLSLDISGITSGNSGKLLVAMFYHDSNSGTFSTPSGWSTASGTGVNTVSAYGCIGLFTKTCAGNETAVASTMSASSAYIHGKCLVIADGDTTTPINIALCEDKGGGSTWTSPNVTTTVDDCLIFQGGGSNGASDWVSADEPAGTTLVHQHASASSWFGLAFEAKATAGALGTKTWDNTANVKRAISFAVAPSTGGGSATLTDVDTDESVKAGATSVPYTGTSLADADGMLFTTGSQSAAATSFVATNATSGTFTAPSTSAIFTAGVKFGAGTWDIQDGGVSLATLAGTIEVPTGYQLHTVSDISQVADADCIYNGMSPAAAVGDVIYYPTTSTLGDALTISTTGFPEFTSEGDHRTDSFVFRIFDDSTKSWSNEITYEIYSVPVLSGITGTPTGASAADISVLTNQAEGTIYVVVSDSASVPSVAQIEAGNDASGSAADGAGSDATPTATTTISLSGLGSGARYAHAVQKNAATTPLYSAVVSSAAFTVYSPSLISVGDGDAVAPGDQDVVAVTTGTAAVDGVLIKSGAQSVACTGIVAADLSVTFDVPAAADIYTANVKSGTVTFDITDGGVSQDTLAGTLLPPDGYLQHDVTTVAQYGEAGCIYSVGTAVSDQYHVAYTSTTNAFGVEVSTDGILSLVNNTGNLTDTVAIRLFDDSAKTWAAETTYEWSLTPSNSASATATSATTATLTVTSNVLEGTLYVVVTTSATPPSQAQIVAGQDHAGAAATFAASDASVTASNAFSVTGLATRVPYYAHVIQANAASTPTYGAVVRSSQFVPGTILRRNRGLRIRSFLRG